YDVPRPQSPVPPSHKQQNAQRLGLGVCCRCREPRKPNAFGNSRACFYVCVNTCTPLFHSPSMPEPHPVHSAVQLPPNPDLVNKKKISKIWAGIVANTSRVQSPSLIKLRNRAAAP
ncbi:hypothetical protein COCCADRAFT_105501, partial [Bipolaris zeicola 26-R-13]